MSFLSDRGYREFLDERIARLDDATARDHVREKFDRWRRQYRLHRLLERISELLAGERTRPNMLYLGCEADLELLSHLAQRHHFDARLFRGFLVADRLWDQVKPEWFSPFPVYRTGQWQDREDTVVFSLSLAEPWRRNCGDKGNDYLERFIDPGRMAALDSIRQQYADRRIVLYVDYRRVQTLAALSEQIRTQSDLATVLLVNAAPASSRREFDAVFEEPFSYLWPLAFERLQPDVYHVNVGWGTQGLPFAPFLPSEAVIDFYDLLTSVADEALAGLHPEPLALTRASERTLLGGFQHIVHRCCDDITETLRADYPGRDIVAVTEYLREPVYMPGPLRRDGAIRLVYGGLLVRGDAAPDDPHYKNFMQMVKFYCHGNLHLHLYPSPYLYGFEAPKGLEELIRRMKLDHVHACMPREDNDFVREIAQYDFGLCIPTPEEVRPTSYGYILPGKIIAYLRAGLPILVPEDQTFVADLVREHGIGVVYGYDDHQRMAELLNGQDIDQLKRNVVRFREQLRIEKGAGKIRRLYESACEMRDAVRSASSGPSRPACKVAGTASLTELIEKLDRGGYLGASEYETVLRREVDTTLTGAAHRHVVARLAGWLEMYDHHRCLSRLLDRIRSLNGTPYLLYLEDPGQLDLLVFFLQEIRRLRVAPPAGFVAASEADVLQARLAPAKVFGITEPDVASHAVVCFSGTAFPGKAQSVLPNDYRERFIEARQFEQVRRIRQTHQGKRTVLYPMYREIHTIAMVARFVGQHDEGLRTISLSPQALMRADFDTTLVEPFFCLWPLIFRMLDPDLVHLNVGWGIQTLGLSPFISERRRTLIDFYEVLSFLPDTYFDKTHSSAEDVRVAEEHFITTYPRMMHMCAEEISTKLAEKYDTEASIVSVTEYMEEPTYNEPPRNDGTIRLVYGGCMLATTNPDDLYYRGFVNVVPHFTRDNLHLYVYNSPYVHGLVENDGLKAVIQRLGLKNIHACKPLELDQFAREISTYDYGVTLLRPKDMEAVEYNYFMATKVLTYLRAGLPVIIDADNRFMAGLIERYNIGLVLNDRDLPSLADTLNRVDLAALKRNVVRFRNEFSIEKGGAKVLKIYHEMLESSDRRRVFPTAKPERATPPPEPADDQGCYEEWISTMARAENRLYYRDQSSHTMASLARHARHLDPTVIVELGTLAGLSLRTWVTAAPRAKIYAVDLSFATLRETLRLLPVDLSRVTLLEQDILRTDFPRLWTARDRVIFFVDAHDLPDVPIMKHVLGTVLPSLPDGSVVIVDDLWFSEDRLTHETARDFLENRVVGEIDELQCFEGYYAPYHEGGSFMGFAEVLPLLDFVNEHRIPLTHDKGSKHVSFVWKKEYLERQFARSERAEERGSVVHNPLSYVPTADSLAEPMRRLAADYRAGRLRDVAQNLARLVSQRPHDPGLAYGLAVCMARGGMLSQARDLLASGQSRSDHPRYRRLRDNLLRCVGPSRTPERHAPKTESRPETGLTIFAMPKAFAGHTAIIQKNAIRSWARLTPRPEILLFGDESGIREMAEEVGARHIPQVDRNEFGTPLVNKLFEAAEALASHSLLAYVNADMILFQSFADGVQKVRGEWSEFLLVGQRWDLTVLHEIDFDHPRWAWLLQKQMEEHAMLHAECGLDYFVFPQGLYREIPPFAIGRTAWDNWLVMAPHTYGAAVVDGTEFITVVHQDHDYGHVAGGREEAWSGVEAERNRVLVGHTDNSARTSGATWALNREGTLVRMPPRQPWHLTALYKDERAAWLLKQTAPLVEAGQYALAACKCEEAITILEVLLDFCQREPAHREKLRADLLAKRYMVACTRLARCASALRQCERAAAAHTRLLENPLIQMSKRQRSQITDARNQSLRTVSMADVLPPTDSKPVPAQVADLQVQREEPLPSRPRPLQAQISTAPEGHELRGQSLAALEEKYRRMPHGTRAKYGMAVRLSDVFRRAGLVEKGRMLATEAETMKGGRALRCETEDRRVAATDERPVDPTAKVTVITACRNSEKYLSECLDSLLDQTMREWELFLIDDGSTDGTRHMIEAYAERDARIQAVCFEDSLGPYVRRNFAIERAHTDFIVIQDADDIMCPTKLATLYAEIRKDDRLAMVGAGYRTFLARYLGPEYSEYNQLPLDHDQILVRFRSWQHAVSHGSAIIRKSLFAEIGPYDENAFASDSFWSAKLALYAEAGQPVQVRNVPECLTLIRMHATNATRTLSTLDPRNRRARYRLYCECKLRRLRDRLTSEPDLDVAAELRRCTCSDFLTRFKAQILAWESEPLDARVVPEYLQSAVQLFNQGYYVSCANTLNGVEAFEPTIRDRVMGYDLLRGMSLYALQMKEAAREYLEREILSHENMAARRFVEDAFESATGVDVSSWCRRHAEQFPLGLQDARPRRTTPTEPAVVIR